MQARLSDPVDLSLHAVRLLGFAGADAVARRFDQDSEVVSSHLAQGRQIAESSSPHTPLSTTLENWAVPAVKSEHSTIGE